MNNIQHGYCQCGCGKKTGLYRATNRKRGIIKGEFARYLTGHHTAKSPVHYKVEDRGYISPCWVWQRAKDPWGYGNYFDGDKFYRAHRYYYEQAKGSIPRDLVLHHDCEVTSCVNPDHVRPVTQSENVRIGWANRR